MPAKSAGVPIVVPRSVTCFQKRRRTSIVLGEPAEALPQVATPELVQLLDRYRVATARAVDAGTLAIAPRTLRTGRVDYGGFCRGFLDGVETAPSDWYEAADPSEVAELLFPIEVVGDALEPSERAAYRPAEWRRLVRDSEDALPAAIGRLADYWRIVRNPTPTIRRDGPKPGRNDPCPCGSGRKFKRCHGDAPLPSPEAIDAAVRALS